MCPATTGICCYSPTRCVEVETVSKFHDDLRQSAKDTPRHNVLIVMDANIGKLDRKFTYNRVTHRNGKLLLNYLEECDGHTLDLIITRASDGFVSNITKTDYLPSDNSAIHYLFTQHRTA